MPDKYIPENCLATEVTKNTEDSKSRTVYFYAYQLFSAPFVLYVAKYSCHFVLNFIRN
jgi:hypothetical protein